MIEHEIDKEGWRRNAISKQHFFTTFRIIFFFTLDIRAQLHFCHLPLQEGVDPWQVLCPDVSQQNCINTVKVAHQLPETGLSVRASVHQHREAVYSKEGTVTAAGREHIAAGTRQLEETDGGGRRQEVKH